MLFRVKRFCEIIYEKRNGNDETHWRLAQKMRCMLLRGLARDAVSLRLLVCWLAGIVVRQGDRKACFLFASTGTKWYFRKF